MPSTTFDVSSGSSLGATRSTSAVGSGSVQTRATTVGCSLLVLPACSCVSSDGVVANVAIVEVCDAAIEVLSADPGQIAPRAEPPLADKLEPRLKHIGDIGVVAMGGVAPIDQKDCDGTNRLVGSVGALVREGARVGFEL